MNTKRWFALTVVFAFLSVISFFNINSYYGDTHHFNGVFGFLGLGIVLGGIATFGLSKVIKNSN